MNIIIEKLKLLNYYNEHTNDLIMYDSINDIIKFHANVNNDNISKLINIIESYSLYSRHYTVYLNIKSYGGNIDSLDTFIQKTKNIEIRAIIETNTTNAGLLLGLLCNYKYVHKSAEFYISQFNNNWNGYVQNIKYFNDKNLHTNIEIINYILNNIKYKNIFTKDKSKSKLYNLLYNSHKKYHILSAKKLLKMGLINEILHFDFDLINKQKSKNYIIYEILNEDEHEQNILNKRKLII